MIAGFGDGTTEDIFNGEHTKAARRIPVEIWKTASRKLDMLNAAHDLRDLMVAPASRLESLHGTLEGKHSIRIHDQFRIVFRWKDGNAREVQIKDYH